MNSSKGGSALRKALLVIQFSLAIIVFISAINVSRQVLYFFNKDLGYNKEQVMIISSLPRHLKLGRRGEDGKCEDTITYQCQGKKRNAYRYDIPDDSNGGNIAAYHQNNNSPVSMQITRR